MTRPEVKEKELQYARDMIRLLPQLGITGDPTGCGESPDVGLTLAGSRSAGLEVVYARDEGIAAGRGAKMKMKKRAVAGLIDERVKAHINFSVSDGAAGVLAAHSMKSKLAAEIAGLVKLAKDALVDAPSPGSVWRRYRRFDDVVDDTGFVCWRDPDRDRGSHDLDGRGIEFCTAVMVRPHDEPLATCTGTSLGQSPSIIQEAIDNKAKKLAQYLKSGYDEQWLLVVGSTGEGGTLDITDAEGEFTSPFHRTFFLETFGDECVELKTVSSRVVATGTP